MSKLKVDEIRSADRSVSSSANITLADDGNVSLGTIFSIDPNYLFKINNAKSKYRKILLIGDYCFRK